MRALVIGATGFIGLHLVDRLLAAGFDVRATVRKSSPTMFLRKRPVELVSASLEEPDKLVAAMQGCDAVFLAGAYYPRYSLDLETSVALGVAGVRNACQAALDAGVPRLIYTSTIATLDRSPERVTTEFDVPQALPTDSVYRAVKWAMEREVEAAAQRGLKTVTLLVGGCVGPGDLRLGTNGLLVLLVRGELPFWVEGMVNLVAVEDVADAHVAAIQAPGDRYNIAPYNVDFGALVQQIVSRYGGRIPPLVSAHTARETAHAAEADAAANKQRVLFPLELVDIITSGGPVTCDRAERELGLRFTALAPAIERAHSFFTRYGYVRRTPQQGRQSL